MRKLLIILSCIFAFASCNNNDGKVEKGTDADITAFTFAGIDGVATIDKTTFGAPATITAKTKNGVDLTKIAAEFTLSNGAKATVNGTEQVSKTTVNDFTNSVMYKVTSEDGKTTRDWKITITSDFKITVSDVAFLPAKAAKVKAVVFGKSSGEPVELASANIENGSATIYLPEAVDEEYLNSLGSEEPEIEISDANLRGTIITFMVCDSSDKLLSNIGLVDIEKMTVAQLCYADRVSTIKGTAVDPEKGETSIWDVSFVKGYNWVQMIIDGEKISNVTNGIPSGAKWMYNKLPN